MLRTKNLALLFAIYLLGNLNVQAQFALTYDDFYPEEGFEAFYSVIMNPEGFDQPAAGADEVWDFSIFEMGTQIWYRQLPVSSGSVPNDYPGSEWLEWSEHNYDGYVQENYLSLGPNGVSFEGHYSSNLVFEYTNPRLYNAYPIDYGEVVVDQWSSIVQAGGGQPYNREGESTFEMDGYGTLVLPHMTLENTVRVLEVTEYVDEINGVEFHYTETTIDWYSEGYKHFVASWSRIEGGLVLMPMTRILYLRDTLDVVPDITLAMESDIQTLCDGECVNFTNLTDISSFDEDQEFNWQWHFPGGTPETVEVMQPPPICYDSAGVFPVILQLTVNGVPFYGVYEDEITVIEGCGPVANFDYTPIVCLGQCYNFENTSQNVSQHFWTFEGAVPETSEEIHPQEVCYLDQTGVFNITLTVVNDNGSSTSITQQITVVNPPSVNAGPDQTIVQGTSTVLSASAGNGTGQYIWQPFEDVTCFSCPATSTYPLNETTTFVVYYEQSGGCQYSDTVTVFVEESFAFGLPGSFSPNGDGVNDVLYVRGSNISQMNLQVYDRYGQKVFESNNQKNGWNGKQNGRPLNAAVFGYVLEVTQSDGNRQVVSGDVSLVR